MNTLKKSITYAIGLPILLTLASCGGGGGGAAATVVIPVSSTLSFPLKAADDLLTVNGYSKTFNVSGSCTGTGTDTTTPATTVATFETVSGFSSTGTFSMNLPGCPTLSGATPSTTYYYDGSYVPQGSNTLGVAYGVFTVRPIVPTTVLVGASGVIGTENLYTDNTKTVTSGRYDFSYVIEPDTANTAIVNLTLKDYDAANTLISTQQNRFRLAMTGALVPISVDAVLYSTNPVTHLVWTYN